MLLTTLERAAHLIGVHVERAGRDLGVTQAEAHVLVQLANGGPVPIAELHRSVGTKRSTLTNVLDRLERRGLVRRQLNPHDRRSFTIHVTPTGAGPARRLADAMDELEAEVRRGLGERDVRSVTAVVDVLVTATRSARG